MSSPVGGENLEVRILDKLSGVDVQAWDKLAGQDPFLRHGFLSGLEETDCLQAQGWYPQHLAIFRDQVLCAAMPLYVRDNSYGEFVFDWSWADAYERAGGHYYPKLVTAIPFSPVTGRRLLVADDLPDRKMLLDVLTSAGVKACEDNNLSSWHCLFPEESELEHFESANLMLRLGCQYHWFNHEYQDFDHFLAQLTSKKRKQIKRERRRVAEQDVVIETLVGDEISTHQWEVFHRFYCSTFLRKWGEPRLTLEFFETLNDRLPGVPMLILAKSGTEYVAGAFALIGGDTLYGRHWGCTSRFDNLHFELCYYRTIDFCIEHGLKRLDAGAQGEHKLSRGFVPIKTWSAHWIRDPGFRRAVDDFLQQERGALSQYIHGLDNHVAFRQSD